MSKQDKLADLLNRSGWLTKRWTEGQDVNGERKDCNKEIAGLIFPEDDEDEEPVDWKPNFPDRAEILKTPLYNEFRIHYMCLAGWAYRNIDEHPSLVHQQIYEIARRTRIAGAKYLRSFLINGSRAKSEKYIMDALPWIMVIDDGRRKIDFESLNLKWWRVVRIIEEACKYWGIQHMPTYRMARYNRDIFRAANNLQRIEGEWGDESAEITGDFMRNYMLMQKNVRKNLTYNPACEFINEPQCVGNHAKLGMIADYHLKLWREVDKLTTINKVMTCSGQCEGAHLNLIERGHYFGRDFGSDEFKDRKIQVEFHGVSDLQSLYDEGFLNGLGSRWRHLAYNEDGSDSGSYSPIPWTPFRLANAEELYDMQYHGHIECRKRNKIFYHTVFMLDCLRQDKDDNMIAKEEFDPQQLESMNWDRAGTYKKMREEL